MTGKRDKYTDNQHSILYGETGGICPLCTQPILFTKPGSKPVKGYEVAHIYPLNATPAQVKILAGYPVPADINALENVIALCPSCHTKYDKDFQLAELIMLQKIKEGFLNEAQAKLTVSKYALQEEVYDILDAIATYEVDRDDLSGLNFDLATVDEKLKHGMSPLQKREIKTHAVDYYVRIRDHIKRLEQQDQYAVRVLQSQIKTYYLAMQQHHPDNKDLVFNYVAKWIGVKTNKSLLASKILTSFFVQNCEVFDVGSN
ncbi:MAG: HNH endonuclease signature motif containing protein [Aquabacterium sp.]|nr:HNH endonuclease signature motif containing protein [Aquabacterium sp.]